MIKVLVIDDSDVIRNLLQEYLSDFGYNVEVAVDGRDGIDMALSNEFALVLCDLHLPRKSGYQVYKEVSAQKPDLKFIMTDSSPDQYSAMARDAGAYGYLTKPFDLNELARTLEDALSETRST